MSGAPRARPALGRSLLRLFTVQGSWNYERMQGVGMGVAEEPLLRDLRVAGDGAAYRSAVARGAHFFNAHPYLCGLAVGAAARAEHEGVPPEQVERLRTALCGPLGSLGDRLVWAGWLPFTSGLALIGVALGLGLPAIIGFLVLFNAGHVALRWWALRAGWTHGVRVAVALRQPLLQRATAVSPRSDHLSAARAGAARPGHAGGVAMAVIEREAKIVNPLGMHARPAAEFVKLASRFKCAVEVKKDDLAVNGKSIMGVMMLAAECGSSLVIRTDGDDAEQAMAALLALVADGFHEMHLTAEVREAEMREAEEREDGEGP